MWWVTDPLPGNYPYGYNKFTISFSLICSICCSTISPFQVWALAVGKKTEMLATGGGDAVVNLWHDSTVEDKEEAFRKEVSHFTFNALFFRQALPFM